MMTTHQQKTMQFDHYRKVAIDSNTSKRQQRGWLIGLITSHYQKTLVAGAIGEEIAKIEFIAIE